MLFVVVRSSLIGGNKFLPVLASSCGGARENKSRDFRMDIPTVSPLCGALCYLCNNKSIPLIEGIGRAGDTSTCD